MRADSHSRSTVVSNAHDAQSLSELLAQSVARFGPRPLFYRRIDGRWLSISYAEFAEMVSDLSVALAALGVTRGDRVAVLSNNSVEWAAIAYATYALGAAVVPMYESQREHEWEFIARDSGARLLLVSRPELFERVRGLPAAIPGLSQVLCIAGSFAKLLDDGRRRGPSPRIGVRRDETAALLYTSGTTGEPKGVVLSHANILANVIAVKGIVESTFDRPEEHRALSFLPWAHALGHTAELHTLIACGASSAIAESVDKIIDNIREVKPTVLVAVPTVFVRIRAGVERLIAERPLPVRWLFRIGLQQALRQRSSLPLSRRGRLLLKAADSLVFAEIRARFGGELRFAICGAAALPREAAEFMDAIGITVYEGYGLTECSPIVSVNTPAARKLGSVGRPLPGVRVVIDRAAADRQDAGEIVVYGDNVMQGYHGRDEENRRVLTAQRGLRTGDLGYLDADGYLFVTGRIKEQYKLTNAKYVVPSQLEDRLKLSAFIDNVMVYGDNRPHNVALVVPDLRAVREFAAKVGLSRRDPEELLQHPRVRQRLAREIEQWSAEFRGYERIRDFAFAPEPFSQETGTMTPSMKLKRDEIMRRWGYLVEGLYSTGAAAELR
jgi:long-chain acyl-CoA synthetase